jgi:hypothetical protein
MIFTVCVYFLSGLPVEPERFLMFALVSVIVSFVAEGLGLAIGATFNVTVRISFTNLEILLKNFKI